MLSSSRAAPSLSTTPQRFLLNLPTIVALGCLGTLISFAVIALGLLGLKAFHFLKLQVGMQGYVQLREGRIMTHE